MLSSFQTLNEGILLSINLNLAHICLLTINLQFYVVCRIVTPSLNEKSQSHREIRSRGDKREVSFTMPSQRTRSLTREEAKVRDDEHNSRFGYDERSASVQRLAMPTSTLDKPSRADSRVTFAPDTLKKGQPPIPPARSREHSTKQQVTIGNHTNRSNITNVRDKVRKSQV